MSTTVSYLIDGKLCSGEEYLDLIEDVFSRESMDTSYIELQNGEGISLGGCSACASILHHRNDGTTWSPKEEVTKELVLNLIKAFIEGNTAILSLHGATILPPKKHKGINLSESGRIIRILCKLFLCFLGIGLIVTIICGMTNAPKYLWSFAFLFLSLALLIIIFAGITYMVDTFRSISRGITTSSDFRKVVAYILLTCGLMFMFIFSVILPLYLIIFMVLKILK